MECFGSVRRSLLGGEIEGPTARLLIFNTGLILNYGFCQSSGTCLTAEEIVGTINAATLPQPGAPDTL